MTQRLITHLRHVDLAVPDFGKQLDFYTNAWGLTAEHSDSGLAFLAAEGSPEQYVVRLREANDKRIDLISFGVATPADADTLAGQLAADGVRLISEPGALQTPGGGYGFRFFDNEGRTVEISADVAVRQHRRIEEGESIPVRLSHVVINSADPEGTRAFYEKHLAFALSDTAGIAAAEPEVRHFNLRDRDADIVFPLLPDQLTLRDVLLQVLLDLPPNDLPESKIILLDV